jgi:hypothetical protein
VDPRALGNTVESAGRKQHDEVPIRQHVIVAPSALHEESLERPEASPSSKTAPTDEPDR